MHSTENVGLDSHLRDAFGDLDAKVKTRDGAKSDKGANELNVNVNFDLGALRYSRDREALGSDRDRHHHRGGERPIQLTLIKHKSDQDLDRQDRDEAFVSSLSRLMCHC